MINNASFSHVEKLNYTGGSSKSYYDCNNDCSMLLVEGTGKDEYESFIFGLKTEGYELINSNTISNSIFNTLIYKKLYVIHTYFNGSDNSARIIVDTNMNLPIMEKTCDGIATLYQMELDYRYINCGMCYIIKCFDGSFFVIDSAHQDSKEDHIRLHKLLRSLTPEGERIVISGWFFSHAHQDHIVKFMDFIKAGFDDYEIECLYYNFPSYTNTKGADKWREPDFVTMKEFDLLIEQHTELKTVKLHTGWNFFVRNLQFEVLSTHEDIFPNGLEKYNDSSAVLMMTVNGCKTLFLGDAHILASDVLCRRYGGYIKSDIVQLAHHGFNGATEEVYALADADVVLIPTERKWFNENLYREPNKKALELSKETYVAGDGTVELRLPYILGSAVVFERELPPPPESV